jgi:hypothetical protein
VSKKIFFWGLAGAIFAATSLGNIGATNAVPLFDTVSAFGASLPSFGLTIGSGSATGSGSAQAQAGSNGFAFGSSPAFATQGSSNINGKGAAFVRQALTSASSTATILAGPGNTFTATSSATVVPGGTSTATFSGSFSAASPNY